ncbi:MAG: molybdate ABC transporter substrate-binding protein [Marmoricola sp.]
MKMRLLLSCLAGCLALTSLAACGSDDDSGATRKDVTIRVFAAASLTETFTELGKRFEKDHPGTRVQFNFGPSSGLAEQIGRGAPADVFASASPSNMDTVVQADEAKDPKDFATNSMEIVTPADNPGRIAALTDLAKPDVKVAVCQAEVPCGKVAAEVFANAKLTVKPATEEVDVKSVLTKVTLGEVDAGVVYVTDVLAAGEKVNGLEIPAEVNAETKYPIATLSGSKHTKTAGEFVELVLSDAGAKVLEDAGFQGP